MRPTSTQLLPTQVGKARPGASRHRPRGQARGCRSGSGRLPGRISIAGASCALIRRATRRRLAGSANDRLLEHAEHAEHACYAVERPSIEMIHDLFESRPTRDVKRVVRKDCREFSTPSARS